MDLDANGLYATTMLDHLPTGKFRWLGPESILKTYRKIKRAEKLPDHVGMYLCVDLEYPRDLYDFTL